MWLVILTMIISIICIILQVLKLLTIVSFNVFISGQETIWCMEQAYFIYFRKFTERLVIIAIKLSVDSQCLVLMFQIKNGESRLIMRATKFPCDLKCFSCDIFSIFKKEQQIIAIPSVLENRYYSSLSEKSHHIFLASSHSKFLTEFLMVTKSCSHNYDGISWIFWKIILFWMWEWKKSTFELTEAVLLMYVLRVMQPWVNIELQGCPSLYWDGFAAKCT